MSLKLFLTTKTRLITINHMNLGASYMSNKRSQSSLLIAELFSSKESSLYCQDLFGCSSKNILSFVVILS